MSTSFQLSDNTIAVLPFANRSASEEIEYFSDGITEGIINALAKIEGLTVTSRTSSFYFKGKHIPSPEIGKKLGVSTILEGSVQLFGDSIRITAQLIDATEDFQFWSEIWDRKIDNIFEVQDEISLLIADRLRERFGHFEIHDHLVVPNTKSIEAYKLFLKGQQKFNRWNPEDVNLAIDYFEKAAELDNELIDAYLGIADSYSFMAVAGFAPREKAWKKSIDAIESAKRIDPDHAGLNYLLSNQYFFNDADFASAMNYILKSLAAKPTYSEAHQFASFLYTLSGDFKKANEHIHFAKSIDPLSHDTKFYEANYYYRVGEHVRAKEILNELLESNSQNLPANVFSIYILIREKKFKKALQAISDLPPEALAPDERLGFLTLIDAMGGKTTKHLKKLEEHGQQADAHHAHSYLYLSYANLGRFDDAFSILDKLFKSASSVLLLSFGGPLGKPIHSDSRYQEYHQKIYPKVTQESDINTNDQSGNSTPKETVLKKALLDEASAADYKAKLKQLIETEKPHLNPDLTLRMLANQLGIHANQLSWLLNDSLGKNFNTFINHYRVEEFKSSAQLSENSHLTILSIAYDCGFNSKTVFNAYFKRETGITPKEFLKQ
jgi:TolB-like protein/AraC-like DNA-binding protein